MFIKAQQEIYDGTDHIYNADVFNEMTPPKLTTDFMSKTSKAIFQSMLSGDSNAVWLMQGWVFLDSAWTPDLMKAWFDGMIFLIVMHFYFWKHKARLKDAAKNNHHHCFRSSKNDRLLCQQFFCCCVKKEQLH